MVLKQRTRCANLMPKLPPQILRFFTRLLLAHPFQHFRLRSQHLVDAAFHEYYFVLNATRQILNQRRNNLHHLTVTFGEPRITCSEVFHQISLVVALGITIVRNTHAVCKYSQSSCFQHLHHHRCPRSR